MNGKFSTLLMQAISMRRQRIFGLFLAACATSGIALFGPASAAPCGKDDHTKYDELDIYQTITANVPGVWIVRIQGHVYQGVIADKEGTNRIVLFKPVEDLRTYVVNQSTFDEIERMICQNKKPEPNGYDTSNYIFDVKFHGPRGGVNVGMISQNELIAINNAANNSIQNGD